MVGSLMTIAEEGSNAGREEEIHRKESCQKNEHSNRPLGKAVLGWQSRWLLLQVTWVWFLAPTWLLTTICNSSARACPLLTSVGTAPRWYTEWYTCRQNNHTPKIKKIKNVNTPFSGFPSHHVTSRLCVPVTVMPRS